MQGTPEHPKAPLGNNFRPPQPLLHRPVRTNIDFRTKQNGKLCPTMYRDVHYKGNMTCFLFKPFCRFMCNFTTFELFLFFFVESPFPTICRFSLNLIKKKLIRWMTSLRHN